MRVISDLHEGDPEDLLAKAEFQGIKDRVMFQVGHRFDMPALTTRSCTSYCPLKHSLNWSVDVSLIRYRYH